jgi:hypothetical protein
MKRVLIIVAAVIVLIGIGLGIYFLFFAPKAAHLITSSNPFDNTASGNVANGTSNSNGGTNAGTIVAPNFVKITDGPVSEGFVATDVMIPDPAAVVSSTSSSTPKIPDVDIHYIDRASGNIYSYLAHTRTLTRRSNKTLPGIQEASWLSNGSIAYVRFLTKDTTTGDEHISTYALPENGEGGYFLESDLAEARTASSTGLFTLLTSTNGSVGTIAKYDGTNPRTLFTSLITSLVVYPAGGGYFAHTKASSETDGYGFQITSAGSFNRILGPLNGLTLLPSPSGRSILYSYVDSGTVHLAVLSIANHTATALPLPTLTEKCVWGDEVTVYCGVPTNMTGNLPDDWYQGAVPFSDRIWRIDMTARVATLVVDPTQVAKTALDAVDLTVDPHEDVLVFTDKKTGSLWMYDL